MGALRYFLAALVLVSHMGISFGGLHPGVIAVVVFYLLAGQVVTGLLLKWRARPHLWRHFYRDRFWRIAPQYFACLLLATALWAWGTESYFLSRAPGLANWLANLTVMPLSFYMYTGQDTFTLIPPAWSLGVELQFYLLAPAIVLAWRRLAVALAASLLVFIAAQCQLLNTDHYGYRLLPGVLFIFLLGACLSPHQPPAQRRVLRGAVLVLWLAGLAYLVWLFRNGPWLPFNREVIVGLVLGVPAVALLQRRRRRHPRREQAQRVLGALSYGVFLFHFPAMWLLGIAPAGDPADVVLVLAMSTLLAAIGHWGVERPLWKRFRPFDDPPADRPVRAGIG